MRVQVKPGMCAGHARCNYEAEDLFPLDDGGYVELGESGSIPADRTLDARRAVAACPERALRLVESDD